MKDRAIQGFMSEWAGRHDLPRAAAWVESLPIEQRGIYARSVGSSYVRSNPKAGAEWWLAQLTEKEDCRIALENIVQTWTMNDIGAAGAWLNQQGDGPETDSARSTYAFQLVYRDPETALKWAQSINEPSFRDDSSARIWGEWRKKDSAAAERFLAQSGWSEKLIAEARRQ